MVTLLGPILAQLVTLSAGARAEGRVISVDTTHYYEAAGRPVVALELLEQRFRLQAVYSPSFTLTPLDSNPQLLVFHSGGIGASYAWRRTVLSVGEFIGYGEQNFRVLATAGNTLSTNPNQMPTGTGTTGTGTTGTGTTGTGTTATGTTGTGTTGTGSTGTGTGTPTGTGTTPVGTGIGAMGGGINSGTAQPPTQHVLDENIRFITSTTSAGLGYQLSASSSLGFGLAYIVAGALDAKSKADYPTVHGPVASANVNDRVDRANGLGASVSYQYSVASNGNVASLVGTNGNWTHDFNARSSSQLGLGVSGGRNSRTDGYVAYSIYPTFVAGVTNVTRLSPGSLALSLAASSAPALDPVTLKVDPRVSLVGSAGWQRERLSATLFNSATFSASSKQGLSTVGGGAGVAYLFGAAFSMDAGVRVAYQVYEGQTVLPFTYAGYLGMTFGLSAPLN